MRVLLAIDGSACSDRARDLVAGIDWPPGSVIRVVAALERGPALFGVPWLAVTPVESADIEAAMAADLERALAVAATRLERPDRSVERELLRGRPASAIVEEAGRCRADLVVVGGRGHGTLESMLLGSTSAEIVDHAPCPVLVARGDRLNRIVLAEDGSAGAAAARDVLRTWPIFAAHPAIAVSISEVPLPFDPGLAPGMYGAMLESFGEARDQATRLHLELARRSAAELTEAGLACEAEAHEGDPAAQLLRLADERGAGLLVVGTRGRTGLTRLFLGSVARNVLLHAHCSVLVVHAPKARPHDAPSTAEERSAADPGPGIPTPAGQSTAGPR